MLVCKHAYIYMCMCFGVCVCMYNVLCMSMCMCCIYYYACVLCMNLCCLVLLCIALLAQIKPETNEIFTIGVHVPKSCM